MIVKNFQMPGAGMPNFRRNGVLMAKHGIYDLRQHLEEVVMPVLRKWNIFERTDFTAARRRGPRELGKFLENLEGAGHQVRGAARPHAGPRGQEARAEGFVT